MSDYRDPETDWREGFRGGFGNSGQMSEAAYQRGALGVGYWESPPGVSGVGGELRENRGRVGQEEPGGASGRELGQGEFGGGPESGYPPGWSGGPANEATWAAGANGPRGTAVGFSDRTLDWTTRGEGPHSGRGPLRYQRSDERVHEDVCERLTEHGGVDASGIEVTCEGGVITLEGTVPDHRSKRLAEEVAQSARGVREVHNQLRVGGDSEQGRAFKLMK